MPHKTLTRRLAVAGQLSADAIRDLAEQGFTTVICNRPDGEEPGQPPLTALEAAAREAGLAFHHIPVSGGEFPESAITAFGEVLEQADGKVMAYCRSGTRSTCLWALSQARHTEPAALIEAGARAGYDLSGLAQALTARHGNNA
ncbi:MAG: FAD-dependent pyridine nucleotide-disulfide oxidoreductase [Oceanicaulis sp. HLUCCA04]|nr:MAG: FAD-dependent pyridine nucleotide-disulfide oxidoreductase [Oceanicaulis sp. HLUCCA04]